MKLGDILGTLSPAYGMMSGNGLGGMGHNPMFGLAGLGLQEAGINPLWMLGGLGGVGLGALLHHHSNPAQVPNSQPGLTPGY